MTAHMSATRQEAIVAAADLFAGDPAPDFNDQYSQGIVQVLADTFGADVDDHDQAKEAIWAEILTEIRTREARAKEGRAVHEAAWDLLAKLGHDDAQPFDLDAAKRALREFATTIRLIDAGEA